MQKLLFTFLVTIITITRAQARVAYVDTSGIPAQPAEDIVAVAATPAFYEEPFFIAMIIFTALIIALVTFIKFFRKK